MFEILKNAQSEISFSVFLMLLHTPGDVVQAGIVWQSPKKKSYEIPKMPKIAILAFFSTG